MFENQQKKYTLLIYEYLFSILKHSNNKKIHNFLVSY